MFSSPVRNGPTPRRRQGESLAGSIRSSRASTPGFGARTGTPQIGGSVRKRESMRPYNQAHGLASTFAPAFGGDGGESGGVDGDSTMMSDTSRMERRKEKARSTLLEEGTVLSRDDNHSITVFSRIPYEAHAALQAASPYDPIKSHLDAVTGFAYLVVHNACFVWSFFQRGYESPTCFTYDVASLCANTQSTAAQSLVLCSFVPKGADREPGVLLLSPSGTLRYSESVSNAATLQTTSQQDGSNSALGLGAGEFVTELHRCSSNTFVAATTHARLFGIRFIASGGQLRPTLSVFAQPRGIFGRLFGAAATLANTNASIVGLTSGPSSGENTGRSSDVIAVTQQVFQKWTLTQGRGERLVCEDDIRPGILAKDDRISEGSHSAETLRLVDVVITNEDNVVILYSFALTESGALHYGLASVDDKSFVGEARVSSTSLITYNRMPDVRAYSQPKLLVPLGGPIVFIVFTEALIFRMLDSDGGLEEAIELRDVANNRVIGMGSEPYSSTSKPSDTMSYLSIVTQRSGILSVEVDVQATSQLSELIKSGEDRSVVDTHRLKTKLERGVFHADNAQNPISFDLPIDARGDLIAASEQLSDDIVRSESASLTETVDLKSQLTNRLERLHSLAAFLALNGMMGSLSQSCLRRLCADAQLLAAAIDLWDYVNDFLDTPARLQGSGHLLGMAIDEVLRRDPSRASGDALRHFFRYELRKLNDVLQNVVQFSLRSTSNGLSSQSSTVCETNRIVLSCFQAAARYRNETVQLYQLVPQSIGYEAWTCTAEVVRLLQDCATATSELIRERTRQMGSAIDQGNVDLFNDEPLSAEELGKQTQHLLKGQLGELVGHTLNAYEERLAFLSCAGLTNPSSEREFIALSSSFIVDRRTLLLSLTSIGRLERAFSLAEQHRDFVSLTELCGTLTSVEQESQRLRSYLDKYGEAFASALYSHYVQTGQLRVLLSQDETFYGLLARFLDSEPALNRIAWLQDIAIDDFSKASQRLLVEGGEERDSVASKRTMLSLAKLSHISQLTEVRIAGQGEQAAIEIIDDQLDLVNVHDRIRQSYIRSPDDNDGANEVIAQTVNGVKARDSEAGLARIEEAALALHQVKPISGALFDTLAQQVLSGQVVLSEDLIDLLTLHDANEASIADFTLSLEVFVRARDMPPSRAQAALSALWRRIVLFDDWDALTQTTDAGDAVISARLRSTALYGTLLSAAGNEATSKAVLELDQMNVFPSIESLEARLLHVFREEKSREDLARLINGLIEEAQAEWQTIQRLAQEVNLPQWYIEIRRLVDESLLHGERQSFNDQHMEEFARSGQSVNSVMNL